MARTIETIQQQIISAKEAEPSLSGLTSDSRRAIWRLWVYITAVAINLFEQLQDVYRASLEALIDRAAPASPLWLQDKVLKFQYSADNPQVLQVVDAAVQYPTENAALRIVTRASVKTTLAGQVQIKVAKGNPPGPLASGELDALRDYVTQIGIAGVNYTVQSLQADRMMIEANIYFAGQFAAVIQQSVVAAIDAFFAAVPFDGSVRISDLEAAIKAVPGVNDVMFINVKARAQATAYANATDIISGQTQISRLWNTVAGYVITEDETGHTLADTLTYIAE